MLTPAGARFARQGRYVAGVSMAPMAPRGWRSIGGVIQARREEAVGDSRGVLRAGGWAMGCRSGAGRGGGGGGGWWGLVGWTWWGWWGGEGGGGGRWRRWRRWGFGGRGRRCGR